MLYLDNSATTKPYPEVLDTYLKVAETFFANPSSIHKLGSDAEKLLTSARKQTSELLGVNFREIIFTSGGTEGNNLAIKGAALANKHKGNHIITTEIEHPSVIESVKQLKEIHNFDVTFLPVDENGFVSLERLKNELCNETILVSIMSVNNEIGSIQPIEGIGNLLLNYPNVLFHVDHTQGITKIPLNIKSSSIDLCTISGHKFHALNGTGALYVREGVKLTPILSGGSQEGNLRSGTESLPGIVSMTKALRMAIESSTHNLAILTKVRNKLLNELSTIEGVVINTPISKGAPHIINFSVPGLKAEVLVHFLEEKNIFVSTNSACSSKRVKESTTLLAMNKGGNIAASAIRLSFSLEQTEEIIEPFIIHLKNGLKKLTKVTR
ncbi:cysteine desulfurase family protein [Metabacillus herbersteinensis]|uniref:Cysteine desulfurase family protein n=1 Tax=Metabacillus herbersteinensis TaxID=283816 RepID=A0ABV6GBL0_9BACI